ncbi:TetR family transcriptional regulator [Streptomyces sp. NPDC056405]|uniref:TetR family transcriptional regulator n=1 Tax=Streptomyces sp. NPDC056405 TaxID=3345811 RepID=UPI0035E11ABD
MMPRTAVLDAETILAATEDVLRRHGPAKATVVDVARALGVSHAAVYRHFSSKAALREAVTRRWIDRSYDRLAAIADDTTLPPPERLRTWLTALFTAKRAKALDDPELTATYAVLAAEHNSVVAEHVAVLVGQVRAIVSAGAATGDFDVKDPGAVAQAVFDATLAFHHPAHAPSWQTDGIDTAFDHVCTLLIDGLRAVPR